MKSLGYLAVAAIMASTAWTNVHAREALCSVAPLTDAPHAALVSAENDLGLQQAVEALQRKTGESRVSPAGNETNLLNEQKRASRLRHRIHRLHKHAEEHVLILGGPEAFSL